MILIATALLSVFLADSAIAPKLFIKVPPGIPLSEQEVRSRFPNSRDISADRYETIEIVIYVFSLGIEKLTYSESGQINTSTQKGEIKALIKLKMNSTLKKVLFVNAEGSSKEEILKNFSRSVLVSLQRP